MRKRRLKRLPTPCPTRLLTVPSQLIIDRLEGIRSALVAHHSGGTGMPNESVGNDREIFLREFLQTIFPPSYRFGSGAIVDKYDQRSGALDIVVEHPFEPSLPLPGGTERLYLASGVAAVVEVKSNASAQWSQVERTVEPVRRLRRDRVGSGMVLGSPIRLGSDRNKVPICVVAFKGFSSIESLHRKVEATPFEKRPNGVLILDPPVFWSESVSADGGMALAAFVTALAVEMSSDLTVSTGLVGYLQD